MLPLVSKAIPTESGASSLENCTISCSTLSSKTLKFSLSSPVTNRLIGSVTATGIKTSVVSSRMSARRSAIDSAGSGPFTRTRGVMLTLGWAETESFSSRSAESTDGGSMAARKTASPTIPKTWRSKPSPRALQFHIDLADEAITGRRDLLDAGVVFSLRLGGRHFVHRLALLHELRDLVAHPYDHVAVRDHRVALDDRPMARDDLGIRPRKSDHPAEAIDHPVQAAAVGAIDIGVLNGAVEITGHDHV